MKTFLAWAALLPAGLLLSAAGAPGALTARAEEQTLNGGRQVYVLANDNAIIPGLLEGFDKGYLVLRLPDKLLRFSPQDLRAVFLSEEAAREGLKKFLERSPAPADKSTAAPVAPSVTVPIVTVPEPSADAGEKTPDKDFQQALEQARAKAAALTPAQRLAGPETMFLEAQNYLLEPGALLEPGKVVPVIQACLLAARPKQKERAEDLLRRYMRSVGSSELTPAQRELVRSRVQRLYQIIAGARE